VPVEKRQKIPQAWWKRLRRDIVLARRSDEPKFWDQVKASCMSAPLVRSVSPVSAGREEDE
jgi:hypothetical protein